MKLMSNILRTFEWYEVKPGVHKIIKDQTNDYLILIR